ncbi:MAG: flagellar biosynthetic protein FliR [Thermodesulfovibrio sp.]|nr:flagellar biosynthetic protein FliR [Thermodesulfovibrio sp.]
MNYLELLNENINKFIPVFIKTSIVLFFIPYIGSKTTPLMFRFFFAICLSLATMPYVPELKQDFFISIFNALVLGLLIGLMVRLIISALEMASQWISIQVGFTIANVFNPQFGEVFGPLTIFYEMFMIALFFSVDFHLNLIEIMIKSFDITYSKTLFGNLLEFSSIIFSLSLKLSAPVLLIQLLMNLGLGFLNRIMPQANVFFVGFPLLLATGIAAIWLSFPMFTMVISKALFNLKDALISMLR